MKATPFTSTSNTTNRLSLQLARRALRCVTSKMKGKVFEEVWIFVYCMVLITGLTPSDAFVGRSQSLAKRPHRLCEYFQRCAVNEPRSDFLESLDLPYELNLNNPIRTWLLQKLVDRKTGLPNPGSVGTFAKVAPGTWRVVYAPHMTIAARAFKVCTGITCCCTRNMPDVRSMKI